MTLLPRGLRRDVLFYTHASGLFQAEFVVDPLAASGLANAALAVTSPIYSDRVQNIRGCIFRTSGRRCDHKARCLESVDWRPREWNVGADNLVRHAMSIKSGSNTLTV